MTPHPTLPACKQPPTQLAYAVVSASAVPLPYAITLISAHFSSALRRHARPHWECSSRENFRMGVRLGGVGEVLECASHEGEGQCARLV